MKYLNIFVYIQKVNCGWLGRAAGPRLSRQTVHNGRAEARGRYTTLRCSSYSTM